MYLISAGMIGVVVAFLVRVVSAWLLQKRVLDLRLKSGSRVAMALRGMFFVLLSVIGASYFYDTPIRYMFFLVELLLLGVMFETDWLDRQICLFPVILLGSIGLIDQLVIQRHSIWLVFGGWVVGGGFFALQYLFSNGKAMGKGDISFGMALGLLFGGPRVLSVLLCSYVIGSVIALLLIATKRWKRTDPLPLGSFLAIGSVVVLFLEHPWTFLGF